MFNLALTPGVIFCPFVDDFDYAFIALLWVVMGIPISALLGRMILGPLSPRSGGTHRPTQFRINDLLLLLAQVMLAGYFVHSQIQDKEELYLQVYTALTVLLAWWWWLGARRLACFDVTDPLRRTLFLGIVVPYAYGGSLLLLRTIVEASLQWGPRPRFNLVILLICLGMSLYGCRAISKWVTSPLLPNSPRTI